MQPLSMVLAPPAARPAARPERRRYRSNAVFVRDAAALSTPLDRNARAKLLALAEGLERRSKSPGRRNGALGYVGLAVLRVLLLRFANASTGLCCPSILQLQTATGLSRQAVVDALARLEASGLLRITRRIIRTLVERVSPVTGLPEKYVGTIQSTSIYAFPGAIRAEGLFVAPANARPFPARRKASFFGLFGSWEAGSTRQTGTTKINKQ